MSTVDTSKGLGDSMACTKTRANYLVPRSRLQLTELDGMARVWSLHTDMTAHSIVEAGGRDSDLFGRTFSSLAISQD